MLLWTCLILLVFPLGQAQASDPKQGKEVYDTFTTAVSMAYPPAGAMFAVVGEFLELTGYFGKAQDPVAEAITRINQRLDALETRMSALEDRVRQLTSNQFRDENLARTRRLRDHRSKLLEVLDAFTQKPTDKSLIQYFLRQAQQVAADFLVDKDLWLWSDMALKDYTWQGQAVKAGDWLAPDFKPWPTMEFYTLSLITWMAAIEYAAQGNSQQVKTYDQELQKHINFLSVRPGWNERSNQPDTLPENIKARITGWFMADKYPEKKICYFHEYIQDTIAREIKHVQTFNYPTQVDNVLCNVPQGFVNLRHTEGEKALESAYGTKLMMELAEKLSRLKNYGTVREQFIGTFAKTPPNHQQLWIYGIRQNGELIWYRKDSNASVWQGPKTVGIGWNSFKDVIPAGGACFFALTQDGKLLWYRHDGFNDGSFTWPKQVEVGQGWAFARIFSGGQGIVYAIKTDGTLLWYRNNDNLNGSRQWKGPKVVGSAWNQFKDVLSTGLGAIYAVRNDGRLSLYQHEGYLNGVAKWQPDRVVGTGWNSFKQIVPSSDGVILAILPDGKLLWYKHLGLTASLRFGKLKEKKETWEGPVELG